MNENKKCNKCELIKPIDEFYKLIVNKDGKQTYFNICKSCSKSTRNKEKAKEYYWNNKEEILKRNREGFPTSLQKRFKVESNKKAELDEAFEKYKMDPTISNQKTYENIKYDLEIILKMNMKLI